MVLASTAMLFCFIFGGVGFGYIYAACGIGDEKNALKPYRLAIGILLIVTAWLLIHISLDLNTFGRIYMGNLLW
jgi:hypothetical protein